MSDTTRTTSPLTLAYSILCGPILWFVHFILVYGLAEFGCRANFNNVLYFTPETIRTLVVIITIVILLAVGVGGLLAFRSWRTLNPNSEQDTDEQARLRFLVVSGLLMNGLFFFSIIVTMIPAFVLSACDRAA